MGKVLSKDKEHPLPYFDEEGDTLRPSNELMQCRQKNLHGNPEKHNCHLPDDLWLRIFSFFSFKERVAISSVCRKWNQLCRDSTFWRNVDFLDLKAYMVSVCITDGVVNAVASYSTAIQTVNMSGEHCKFITDTSLRYLAKHCPQLRELDLSGRTLVTNRGINNISRSCKLEQLILDKCYKISDKGLKHLTRCGMLRKLSIAYCIRITDNGLSAIAKKCRRLETLTVAGCTKIGDKSIKVLGFHCKLLQKINLKHTTEISIDAIEILVRGAPLLSHVELGILPDEYYTVAALNIVVDFCHHLEFLSFQHHNNRFTTGGRKIISKKRLVAFVSSLNACVLAH